MLSRTGSWLARTIAVALFIGCGSGSGSGRVDYGGYRVSVDITGTGAIISTPAGINCPGTCSASFLAGTRVSLVAAPVAGSVLQAWGKPCIGGGACSITLDADTEVTATFVPAPAKRHVLTVHVAGSGSGAGRVISTPGGIDCPASCNMNVAEGTSVSLRAEPESNSKFAGWGGACSDSGNCSFLANGDTAVWANFSPLAPDPCAGLMAKLPPAETFVSPGNVIDGSCGGATTDGLGTVYNFDNRNGGGIYSSKGGRVGGENLQFPLASGVVTFGRSMSPSGQYGAYAPDGTLLSVTDWCVPIAQGEQANGGSIIVTSNAYTHCAEILRFDDSFARTSDVHVCAPGSVRAGQVLVDARDRALIVYVAEEGNALGIPAAHYGARWFDSDWKGLTDWFDAGPASGNGRLRLSPLIGGGAALRSGSDWVATIPSGVARADDPPAAFEKGKDARIVLGGRAYAMVPFEVPGPIDIVEAGGRSCGALTPPTAFYNVGRDGTLVTVHSTVGPSGRLDMCTATYYPQALK